MEWFIKKFEDLTPEELRRIYEVRVAVFVVEQKCPYQEVDLLDRDAWHLWLADEDGIAAYLRVLPAGTECGEVSIGRVLTVRRGCGYGRQIFAEGIRFCFHALGARRIRILAQVQAEGFYEKFGFVRDTKPFDWDGIEHVGMRWEAPGGNRPENGS